MANVRSDAVTFKGNPVDVAGTVLKPGDAAPDFKLQSPALEDVTLAQSAGKTRIIATVPSLDTPVCSEETKKFNDLAKSHPDVEILVVSMDLPFAIKRWCGAEGVDNVKTLSAHRCTKFGEDYGVLLSGGALDRLLVRAVFVVDGGWQNQACGIREGNRRASQLRCRLRRRQVNTSIPSAAARRNQRVKSEIRISKSESNSNSKIPITKTIEGPMIGFTAKRLDSTAQRRAAHAG